MSVPSTLEQTPDFDPCAKFIFRNMVLFYDFVCESIALFFFFFSSSENWTDINLPSKKAKWLAAMVQ